MRGLLAAAASAGAAIVGAALASGHPAAAAVPVCSTTTSSSGASVTLCVTSYPTSLDNSSGLSSLPGTYTATATPNHASPNSGKPPGVGSSVTGAAVVAAVGDAPAGQTSARQVANLIASWSPNMLFYLGDVYQYGSYQEFLNSWSPVFGPFDGITAPIPGNHEYKTWPTAAPYFWYWHYNIGAPSKKRWGDYYSFDLAGWHVISLDSDAAHDDTSPQLDWLRREMASHLNSSYPCTLLMWHRPRYSTSAIAGNSTVQPFWDATVDQGADLFLNAHAHDCERSLSLNRDGTLAIPGSGVTQLIVGTGGNRLGGWRPTASMDRFAYRDNTNAGAPKLILHPGGAEYQFLNVDGSALDAGAIACH